MKKILLIFIMLTFIISNYAFANEQECKKFNILCKTKQSAKGFWKNTKEFQKKGLEKSTEQIKDTKLNK